MYNARLRVYLRLLYAIIFMLGSSHTAHAAFYITKARPTVAAAPANECNLPAAQQRQTYPERPTFYNLAKMLLHPDTYPADSYKGILALVFGAAGITMTAIAFSVPSVIGLVIPAFFSGVAGIVFGAMRKSSNRRLGRAGLVMGIVTVAIIILFVAAVFIALASFT